MADAGRHPNIELLTLSEVQRVDGYVGNFKVTVLKKARYVDEKECTACADCLEVCPVVKPDEFNLGLSTRKAIYQEFPQAVPAAFVLNMEDCLGNEPIACGKCLEACEKRCIDYDDQDKEIELEVGTIIVATGMEVYDPTELDEFGYTQYENVITSLEFERLINSGGPTEGHLIRLTDRKQPKTVAFIQCVGSRCEKRGNPYCSNICCMNTIKDTLLIKDHWPEVQCKVFYMDIRAFGKGFEDLYKRSMAAGVQYIRGIPGDIYEDPKTKNLILTAEDTTTSELKKHEVDMVILSIGVVPPGDMDNTQQQLTLQRSADGFFLEAHPKLKPVDAATQGIFFAGCAEGPKDIKDSVTQAGAAAARANRLMRSGEVTVEAITSMVDPELCTSCGICARVCPYNAIYVDTKKKTPAVVVEAACAGCGTCSAECPFGAITMRHFTDEQIMAQIEAILAENAQDKIVAFACNWCSYPGADLAGTSRLQYPPNARLIRTMCSGRVDERFILKAFKLGAPIVLVSGCHFTDCHYINAVTWTQKRIEKLWDKLESLGIRPERLQLDWVSAAEGQKWARVMREVEQLREAVTAKEIEHTKRVITEDMLKKRTKKVKAKAEAVA
ncbi:MAG: methyl-viologen-reducing hydrogenase subunit delta [candidate division Zixibacteria bacterium SM23_81]|nr:MAG: methyl-viologen-reducing hydrogenase subunit delta [candidate division Zixibacteria bacterium SM23_81]